MKTIGQYIQDVQTAYSKGIASDDSRLRPRFIYSFLKDARATLITQQSTSTQKISDWVWQTLTCVELETAPIHECPCLPPKGCTVYRTKELLPTPLVNLNSHLIKDVTSVTGELIFHETTWDEKKHSAGRRYVKKKDDYFFRNGRLYITMQTGPTMVTLTGLFHDPLDAYSFPSACDNCEGDECIDCESPMDKPFPVDPHKAKTVVDMTVIKIMEYFNKNLEDRSNNGADSPEQMSK